FTSQSVTAQSINSNENAGATIGPNTSSGTPESCANFDLGTVTGYELVTDVGFFYVATTGAVRALLGPDCHKRWDDPSAKKKGPARGRPLQECRPRAR